MQELPETKPLSPPSGLKSNLIGFADYMGFNYIGIGSLLMAKFSNTTGINILETPPIDPGSPLSAENLSQFGMEMAVLFGIAAIGFGVAKNFRPLGRSLGQFCQELAARRGGKQRLGRQV
ncbi:MAG: hypothetical protein ABH950_06970 [Candidatus Altiarchaeota archaeon]